VSNPQDGMCEDLAGSQVAHLVRRARGGDLGAFDTLVGRFQRKAAAVAYRLLNNLDDAMEISQDAFLRAYEKLGTLSKPERFGPWLMRIVSNLALNRRRSRALRSTVSLDASGTRDEGRAEVNLPDARSHTPAEIASAGEMQERLARALEDLPQMQREALVLFSMGKMPQKQVAEMLGCSVEAVKWHVFTARKKLKEVLKEYL